MVMSSFDCGACEAFVGSQPLAAMNDVDQPMDDVGPVMNDAACGDVQVLGRFLSGLKRLGP